jgi:hypothetical protein
VIQTLYERRSHPRIYSKGTSKTKKKVATFTTLLKRKAEKIAAGPRNGSAGGAHIRHLRTSTRLAVKNLLLHVGMYK